MTDGERGPAGSTNRRVPGREPVGQRPVAREERVERRGGRVEDASSGRRAGRKSKQRATWSSVRAAGRRRAPRAGPRARRAGRRASAGGRARRPPPAEPLAEGGGVVAQAGRASGAARVDLGLELGRPEVRRRRGPGTCWSRRRREERGSRGRSGPGAGRVRSPPTAGVDACSRQRVIGRPSPGHLAHPLARARRRPPRRGTASPGARPRRGSSAGRRSSASATSRT